MYNTIIIGAGAAGLFIGANLEKGNNLILEGEEKPGKKILITGGGMCNITNCDDSQTFISKFGSNKKANFIKPALLNLNTQQTQNLLVSWGLPLVIRDDGKVFPESLKAQSVIDLFLKKIRKNNIKIYYNSKVKRVEKTNDGFTIKTSTNSYICKNVVIACGGKSFPDTGSDGSGYKLSDTLGHKIITPTPSLAGIKVESYSFKNFAGQSIRESNIDFFRPNEPKRYLNSAGDLLFTHQGFSGPVILNNSRQIKSGDRLEFTLVPCNNKEELRSRLTSLFNKQRNFQLKKALREIGVSKSISDFLIKFNNIENVKISDLNKKQIKKIINSIISFNAIVKSKGGFNSAMATAGGVDINQINRKNMESKLLKGLFFAGEVIDIDGDTGGYNIQAALSTGKLVSDYLNKTI